MCGEGVGLGVFVGSAQCAWEEQEGMDEQFSLIATGMMDACTIRLMNVCLCGYVFGCV